MELTVTKSLSSHSICFIILYVILLLVTILNPSGIECTANCVEGSSQLMSGNQPMSSLNKKGIIEKQRIW
jgi:hypothetical protein